MAAIEDVREVADAVASVFRNAYDRWRDLPGATRIERCELLWDSHLAQNFKDRSIAETVHIPVPGFQQLLWAVIDGRHASSNRRDKPLPAMEKINESPPVHNSILTPRGKPEDRHSPALRTRTWGTSPLSHCTLEKPAPARMPARAERWSILAWQVDYSVGKVQCEFIQRKIRVLDLLGEHDVAVAIVARKRSGLVGTYGELPDLKFFGGNGLVVRLNDRDFVQKPIRSTMLGNVLRAVGVENVPVDPVPIPVFAAGELREIAFAESLRRHVVPLSFEVTPRRGRERQQERPH
jgi:hypothetical protein